jgi:hypothetical protein
MSTGLIKETEMEWIDVRDRLPETHEIYNGSPLTSGSVLIFNGSYIDSGSYEQTYATKKFRWLGSQNNVTKVTHWMPYPPKPK